MKPAFALDFRHDAIALLHRRPGGWHVIGRVTLDEPDLASALSYLRATALGLSPRGLATKLILPDDQILVTTVDAPGPDEAARLDQIRRALEGRTPYPVDELVFDWEAAGGSAVNVAVVWRETLTEAEAFATEHRFNPVSFVASPADGFVGEPWFGTATQAASLLANGETVERDSEALIIVDRGVASDETPKADAEPPEPAPVAATAEAEVIPEAEPDEPAAPEIAFEPEAPMAPVQQEATPVAPALPPEPAFDAPAALSAAKTSFDAPAPSVASPAAPRDVPAFGLSDDEPSPSAAFRATTERSQDRWRPATDAGPAEDKVAAATAPVAPQPEPSKPEQAKPSQDWATQPQGLFPADEAPMALDVEVEEAPSSAARGGSGASAPVASVTDPAIIDDVPPPPGFSPALGFASRRASADPAQSAKVAAPAPRPTVDRPTAARPLVAPPPTKAERPALNRPTSAKPVVAPKETKGLRGLGALVTAPGIPGARKKVAAQPMAPAAATAATAAASPAQAQSGATVAPPPEAAKSLGRGLGGRQAPTRGKPLYLGLILTGLLLLILAVIAAWSTTLAFRSDDGATTDLAAIEAPAADPLVEDEMIADGQDPDLLTATETPALEDVAQDQASDAQTPLADATADPAIVEPSPVPVEGAAPGAMDSAENPGVTSGDEIFLAAKDQAPATPAPLDLAAASPSGDPLPSAQAPPPPFGTVYQFDANGLIVPTPEGIVTPEGVLLTLGKPARVPPPRPQVEAAAQPDAVAAAVAAATNTTTTEPAAVVSDPALAAFRPRARPEGLTPPAPQPDAAAPADAAPADATLPEGAAEDDAALRPVADSRLAGLRPAARPEAVLAAGEALRAANASAAASLAAQAEAAAAAASAQTSPLAIAISRKPAPRPRDLSRAVEAAVAAAVRAPTREVEPDPEPQAAPAPEPEPEQLAAALPASSPQPKSKAPTRGRDAEVEADEEPEVEASAQRGTTSGSVAKQATFRNALALDKTALIGVYGTPSKRYAMVRTSNGRYKKVKVGDSVDGGKVQAITATEVRYQKGSRLMTLALPKG